MPESRNPDTGASLDAGLKRLFLRRFSVSGRGVCLLELGGAGFCFPQGADPEEKPKKPDNTAYASYYLHKARISGGRGESGFILSQWLQFPSALMALTGVHNNCKTRFRIGWRGENKTSPLIGLASQKDFIGINRTHSDNGVFGGPLCSEIALNNNISVFLQGENIEAMAISIVSEKGHKQYCKKDKGRQ